MPYTIGEVARMMNIAPSTLRYYEAVPHGWHW